MLQDELAVVAFVVGAVESFLQRHYLLPSDDLDGEDALAATGQAAGRYHHPVLCHLSPEPKTPQSSVSPLAPALARELSALARRSTRPVAAFGTPSSTARALHAAATPVIPGGGTMAGHEVRRVGTSGRANSAPTPASWDSTVRSAQRLTRGVPEMRVTRPWQVAPRDIADVPPLPEPDINPELERIKVGGKRG